MISRGERRLALAGLVFFAAVAVGVAAEARRGARRPGLGAGVAVAPFDAGPPPDAGYDGGLVIAVVATGPSYGHSGGGTPQTRVWTDAAVDDAGNTLAWQVVDATVSAAVDDSQGSAALIGMVQLVAAATQIPTIGLIWSKPQTAPWNYVLTELEGNISAAAAWAVANGYQLCPRVHLEIVGGYYTGGSSGLPFGPVDAGAGADAGSHHDIVITGITRRIEAHLASLVGSGVAADCATLRYVDFTGPHPGTLVDTQLEYSADFATYNEANPTIASVPMASTTGWDTQDLDDLHFTQMGHRQAAQGFATTVVRAWELGDAPPFYPTAVTAVGVDTIDVTFNVPCRADNSCSDDPPLVVDTTLAVRKSNGVDTYGLHLWHSGTLQTPPAVTSVTAQACAPSATECDVRWVFASQVPDFDQVSFGDVFCKNGDAGCGFGPEFAEGGGSNIASRFTGTSCLYPADGGAGSCVERPGINTLAATSLDAGPVDSGASDAGFAASNMQYLAATSGNYVTVANQGGGSAQCVFAWGDLPTANLDTIFVANASLRGFLGNIGGAWGCAISNVGPTYRVATGSYSTGTRYDVACCYDGTSGPTGIRIYVGGSDVSGTTTGAATTINSDGLTNIPDNAAATDVDEVVVMPGKTSLSGGELLQLRCATKAATDSSPTAGECTGVTTDISAICALATGTRWYGFEGDATDRCGVLNGSAVGTPPYTSY